VFEKVTRIGIDTSPFIYFIEENEKYLEVLTFIFKKIDTGSIKAFSSVLTLAEVLVRPFVKGEQHLINEYISIFTSCENLSLIPVEKEIAVLAAKIRAKNGLKLPDALHFATAKVYKCELFITNDKHFNGISDSEIQIVLLDDLLDKNV
jgi:predicted nucleic acid-binding protein